MTRLNLLLGCTLFVGSLWQVRLEHEGRRLFAQWEHMQSQARDLQNENDELLRELRTRDSLLKIDEVARNELGMVRVAPSQRRFAFATNAVPGDARSAQPGNNSPAPAASAPVLRRNVVARTPHVVSPAPVRKVPTRSPSSRRSQP